LSDQERACAYTLSFTLGILMAGTAFLIAPLLGDFYEHPELVLPFQALSVGLLFLSLTVVPAATLQRELRLKPIALKNMTVGIARVLLTLLLAYLGFGYWALVIGILMHEIGSMVWLSIAA